MFPTPPDSPDGPSDTEGEKEGGRRRKIGSKKVKRGEGRKEEGEERIIWGKRKNPGRKI